MGAHEAKTGLWRTPRLVQDGGEFPSQSRSVLSVRVSDPDAASSASDLKMETVYDSDHRAYVGFDVRNPAARDAGAG